MSFHFLSSFVWSQSPLEDGGCIEAKWRPRGAGDESEGWKLLSRVEGCLMDVLTFVSTRKSVPTTSYSKILQEDASRDAVARMTRLCGSWGVEKCWVLTGGRRGTCLLSLVAVDGVVWLQWLVEVVDSKGVSTKRLGDGGIELTMSRGAGTMVEAVGHVSGGLSKQKWVVDASEVVEHVESNRE